MPDGNNTTIKAGDIVYQNGVAQGIALNEQLVPKGEVVLNDEFMGPNWDVVTRAMKILQDGFVKKMNDEAWGWLTQYCKKTGIDMETQKETRIFTIRDKTDNTYPPKTKYGHWVTDIKRCRSFTIGALKSYLRRKKYKSPNYEIVELITKEIATHDLSNLDAITSSQPALQNMPTEQAMSKCYCGDRC